ncbi:MAG: BamA/TamA family outer membrane protein [Bacteroidota bacterium]
MKNICSCARHRIFFFLLLFLALGVGSAAGQNFLMRYLRSTLNDTAPAYKPKFIVYPTLGFAPETSWEFGFSSLYLYHARQDTINRLSEVNGLTFITLRRQFGVWFDHALYTDKNQWFFLGRLRYQRFPLLYHGVGPDTPAEPIAQVDSDYLLFRERALRQLRPSLFVGLQIDYQRLFRVDFLPTDDQVPLQEPEGSTGASNLSLGGSVVYDTRHNVLNVREGAFFELAVLHSSPLWGSTQEFTTIFSDNRWYHKVNERDVLAAQLLGSFTLGNPPFQQLSLMGGESLMRGYYLGRYRDKNLVAGQIEYRMLPVPIRKLKRIGMSAFIASGTVFSENDPLALNNFVLAGGGGIQFMVFPKKDIFTRFDVAFTREGPGFYLFVGEAF